MKIFKISVVFLCIIILSTFFAGCAKLKEEDYVIQKIEEFYPNTEFVKVVPGETSEGYASKTYTFKNDDFEFTFYDYLESSSGGFSSNNSTCDYYLKLFEFKKDEIDKFIKDSNVPSICLIDTADNKKGNDEDVDIFAYANEFRCEFNIPNSLWYRDFFEFNFYINDYSQIDKCMTFLSGLFEIIEEYIPEKSNERFCDRIYIEFKTSQAYSTSENTSHETDNIIYSFNSYFSKNEMNLKSIKTWTKYEYANLVKKQKITDNKIDINKVKYKVIDKLVINDKEFFSDKYATNFIYNVEDDKYYVRVSFGTEFEHSGGYSDYLQKEIIEEYYPKSNYKINADNNYSEYKIGKNKYKIKWSTTSSIDEEDDMIFYKNGKDMNIQTYRYIGMSSSGADYIRFISIDDFAKILEMEIEDINQYSKAVYLKTK